MAYEGLQEQLSESGEKQNLADPMQTRELMKGRQGQRVSYNVQIAVDSKHKLISR